MIKSGFQIQFGASPKREYMITNRNLPHIKDMIARVPQKYQSDVTALLDELESEQSPQPNWEYVKFNKYKIKVADGDIEIIFELNWSGEIRLVDIKERLNITGILKKIREGIDITPKP